MTGRTGVVPRRTPGRAQGAVIPRLSNDPSNLIGGLMGDAQRCVSVVILDDDARLTGHRGLFVLLAEVTFFVHF